MATAAMDRSLKIWDVRNTYQCLADYKLPGSTGASNLQVGQVFWEVGAAARRIVIKSELGLEILTRFFNLNSSFFREDGSCVIGLSLVLEDLF